MLCLAILMDRIVIAIVWLAKRCKTFNFLSIMSGDNSQIVAKVIPVSSEDWHSWNKKLSRNVSCWFLN